MSKKECIPRQSHHLKKKQVHVSCGPVGSHSKVKDKIDKFKYIRKSTDCDHTLRG